MVKIKVYIKKINGICSQGMQETDFFFVDDHKIGIPDGKLICMYALQSVMSVFPILCEQEKLPKGHWVEDIISMKCPDGKVEFGFLKIE